MMIKMTMKKKKENDNNSIKGKSHDDPAKPAQGDHHIKYHYFWDQKTLFFPWEFTETGNKLILQYNVGYR